MTVISSVKAILPKMIKVWVNTKTFNASRYTINENILAELRKAGVEIPFNQLDVHMIGSKD